MRGLYLNTSIDHIYDDFYEINQYSKVHTEQYLGHSVTLKYDSNEWHTPPIVSLDNEKWFCYGWFIYKNKKNSLNDLVNDYRAGGIKSFEDVTAGMFVIARLSEAKCEVFTDPLGLSTHYIDKNAKTLLVAPTVNVFENKVKNNLFDEILNRQGNLFGNYTVFEGIERIEPGSCSDISSVKRYYQPNFNSSIPLEEVPRLINELCSHWPKEQKALAISGGMDSRLILSASNFSFGYTYGPEHSGDRPIARVFSFDFEKYEEFSYLRPPKLESEETLCERMFLGSSTWAYRLLSAYAYVKSLTPNTHAFFDGYLGDVLQRGAFLKFPGLLGEVFRLFPMLYRTKVFSDEGLLRKRYNKLSEQQFELLLKDYRNRTENLNTQDQYAKLTYYEFVFGRGARHVINGGNLSCGQVFTVVPVFTELKLLHAFLSKPMLDSANYKFIAKVWSNVPDKYKKVRTETGFKPNWPAFFIPYIHFLNRLKLKFLPGGNYGREHVKARKNKQ